MTFKPDDTFYPDSQELYVSCIEYARSKGLNIYENTNKDSYEDFPGITYSTNQICGRMNSTTVNRIDFKTFVEYCDNWKNAQPVTLQLTSQYQAVLDKENKIVNVGCQKIPFSKVEELYKLIS